MKDFRSRSSGTKVVPSPRGNHIHAFSALTHLLSFLKPVLSIPPSKCFDLQVHTAEVQLQVFCCLFNSSVVINMESDAFPFSCSRWARRKHSYHLALLPACTHGFPNSKSCGGLHSPCSPQCTAHSANYVAWLQVSNHN